MSNEIEAEEKASLKFWLCLEKNKVVGFLAAGFGFSVLLIGNVFYEERLKLWEGVSLNIFLYISAFFYILYGMEVRKYLYKPYFYFIGVMLAAVAFTNSVDLEYGFYKYFNLIISTALVVVLFRKALLATSQEYFCKCILAFILILMFAAMVFKYKYGFFDRDVPFLFNGPIVFGRIVGVGLILSLFLSDSIIKTLLQIVLSFGMLWSFSKGPIVAFALTFFIFAIFSFYKKGKIDKAYIWILLLLAVFVVVAKDLYFIEVLKDRFFSAVMDYQGHEGTGTTSVSSRTGMWGETIKIIKENPLGVGLGSWEKETGQIGLGYPHNFFLEVYSEIGILIGTFFIIPYLLFFRMKNKTFFFLAFYLMLCQQVSGDLLDSRYWLVFSFLSYTSKSEYEEYV